MYKLWRGTSILSATGWLDSAAARTLLSPMPSVRAARSPSSFTFLCSQCGQRAFRNVASVSLFAENGSHLFRRARMSASHPLLRGSWVRSFRAIESLRSRDKGGDLELSSEEESREVIEERDEEKSSSATQQKVVKPVERRARGGGSLDAPPARSMELLAIPGVGPRNLRKLVDKGFQGVAQLKQLYTDKVYDWLCFSVDLTQVVFHLWFT